MLCSLLLLPIYRRMNLKLVFAVSTLISAAANFLCFFASSPEQLIILRFCSGIGFAGIKYSLNTIVSLGSLTPENTTDNLAALNAGLLGGITCGGTLGAVIASSINVHTSYLIAGVFIFAFAVAVLALSPWKLFRENSAESEKESSGSRFGALSLVVKPSFIRYALLVAIPMNVGLMFVVAFFPNFVGLLGLPDVTTSYGYLINGLVGIYVGPALLKSLSGKLGQWVIRKKEERAKKKAAEAQKEPGWFKKTAAAAGEKIKSGAGWVKDKAVKGGTWMKNKAVKAGKWLSKKKDDISDWIEEKKQAYADHDDQRYLKRLVRKGGASALNAIALADQDLKHGEYSGNVKHRAEALRDYDEEKRQFMTDEESKAAKAAKKAEPLSAGKVLDVVGDNVDVVGSVMSAHDARKRGNGQQAALDSMDAINSGMGYVTTALKNVDLPGLSAVGDVAEMGTTIGKLGIHSYQKHKLNGVDEAAQNAGVDEADQKYMRIAHSGYGNTLDQEIRSGVGDVAKYGISALGSGLSAVTGGGVSSTVAKGLNKAVDLGVGHLNSSAREKTDSDIGYEDIFGSVEAAKKFKSKHSIDKSTMEILMKRNTGSRSMSDLADRSRYEAARVNHQYLAREGDNGAKKMMAAFGEKNFEQIPLSMIDEKIGQSHTLKELNKRRRLAY